MHFRRTSVITGLLASALLGAASASAELLFSDDFSTGDLSKYNDYFRWSASLPQPGYGHRAISDVQGPHGESIYALRFNYEALSSNASSDAKHWAERRFHLTSSANEKRSHTGASDTVYPEVWIGYSLWVPANYAHGPKNPTNNKGFITLWKNAYGGPIDAAIDWWRIEKEKSRIGAWSKENGVNRGNREIPTYVREDHQTTSHPQKAYAFLESELGTWIELALGFKMSSGENAGDGFIRVYKDGEKVVAWENLNNWHADPTMQGYDRGYILGYANSGFNETTTFYVTDFKFGTSLEAVMSEPASVSPPKPPILSITKEDQ